VKLAGDNTQISDKKQLVKALKRNKLISNKKNVIDFLKTKSPPYYDLFLLEFKDKIFLDDFLTEKNFDSVNYLNNDNQVEIMDSISCMYGYGLSNSTGEYILLICFSTLREQEIFKIMTKEYKEAFKTIVYSDDYRQALPSPFKIAGDYSLNYNDSTTNYLRPIEKLYKYKEMYEPNDFIYVQAINTYSSRVSNSEVFDVYFEKYNGMVYRDIVAKDKFITNNLAVEKILSLCSKSNLAMFNENHFDIRHRLLLKVLLKDLYSIGYRYLALEALSEGKEKINKRGYPVQSSGFYTLEPEMADLIRQAIDIGFTVFGYDSHEGNREVSQAKNIYENSFYSDSLAKVVVLGGHDHIHEGNNNKKWMGFYINDLYGINPTTFSQTSVEVIDSIWLGIVKNDSLTKETVDYLISNNISEVNIPTNKVVNLCFELLSENPFKDDYIMSVYYADEYNEDIKSIPVKNVIIPFETNSITIFLQLDIYIYTIRNKRGDLLHIEEFKND